MIAFGSTKKERALLKGALVMDATVEGNRMRVQLVLSDGSQLEGRLTPEQNDRLMFGQNVPGRGLGAGDGMTVPTVPLCWRCGANCVVIGRYVTCPRCWTPQVPS